MGMAAGTSALPLDSARKTGESAPCRKDLDGLVVFSVEPRSPNE